MRQRTKTKKLKKQGGTFLEGYSYEEEKKSMDDLFSTLFLTIFYIYLEMAEDIGTWNIESLKVDNDKLKTYVKKLAALLHEKIIEKSEDIKNYISDIIDKKGFTTESLTYNSADFSKIIKAFIPLTVRKRTFRKKRSLSDFLDFLKLNRKKTKIFSSK